jgi:hypothetical protein
VSIVIVLRQHDRLWTAIISQQPFFKHRFVSPPPIDRVLQMHDCVVPTLLIVRGCRELALAEHFDGHGRKDSPTFEQ